MIRQQKSADDRLRARSTHQAWLRALERTGQIGAEQFRTLQVVIDEVATRQPEAMALLSDLGDLTYQQLVAAANRYAHWALAQGLASGDRVCLMMRNRPEYVAIWLGISSVGAIVALLNTKLRGAGLAHCIAAARPKFAIVDHTFAGAWMSAMAVASGVCRGWVLGTTPHDLEPLEPVIERLPDTSPPDRPSVSIDMPALLIYTSGTTGLPKAAYVSHRRIMLWSHWFAGLLDIRPTDRLYDCLPFYHSIGGVSAIGSMLVGGAAVVVRERFSANRFWDDIVTNDCTIFQYIGELCRYLVNAQPSHNENRHRLRLACGNGLGADVWERFESRFRIPCIFEFYAATEGNFTLYNCEGKRGAIGRIPGFLTHRFSVALVRSDAATDEPVRDEAGFCIRCVTGETGEAIGEVRGTGAGRTGTFEGYTDDAASAKKLMRDVFVKGDLWIRSGDLMRQDAEGFFYFVDRVGDTFRWKGENVATTEVAAAVASYPGVREGVVYGVGVPGTEGKVGMAAVTVAPCFDIDGLGVHLANRLPEYACPLFLRLCQDLETTATFRPRKVELARQGFNPCLSRDPVFLWQVSDQKYVQVDEELHARIISGRIRL